MILTATVGYTNQKKMRTGMKYRLSKITKLNERISYDRIYYKRSYDFYLQLVYQ